MDFRRLRREVMHCCSAVSPVRRRLVVALACAFAAAHAEAVTYVVGNEAELAQAIAAANARQGLDQIHVGADITLSAALPTITDPLVLSGVGSQRALRRDDGGTHACSPTATNAFRLIDAGADLTLMNLRLSGGCNLVDQGGAVRVQGASLEVRQSTITGNQTFVPNEYYPYRYGLGGIGAGVAVISGTLTIADSVISDNATHGFLAGGGGAAIFFGSVHVERSSISGNQTNGAGPFGAGIYAVGPEVPGAVVVANSTFTNNDANGDSAYGGALMVIGEFTAIMDSDFVGNSAGGATLARGGGINVQNPPGTTISIDRCTIAGNTVTGEHGWGAGLRLAGGDIRLASSSVFGNAISTSGTAHGAGMFVESASMAVVDATVSDNEAGGGIVQSDGGGIGILSEAPSEMALSVYNSTIAGNAAPGGSAGGIWIARQDLDAVSPTLVLESTIVSGNALHGESAEIGRFSGSGTSPSVVANHSLIQGSVDVGAGSYAPDATTLALAGLDPSLQPLADNGGPTWTRALAADSPAIDRGSNVLHVLFDQRGAGHPRALGPTVDIGAYERKR